MKITQTKVQELDDYCNDMLGTVYDIDKSIIRFRNANIKNDAVSCNISLTEIEIATKILEKLSQNLNSRANEIKTRIKK